MKSASNPDTENGVIEDNVDANPGGLFLSYDYATWFCTWFY